jgi:3-hydroxymyristoyl/3-hydroxydecanoyl-(acyl carrier protein) dehydratase
MRWLLIDCVEVLVKSERVDAICAPLDDCFPGHFPERPMVPGSFILEALSQAGTILLETSGEFARKALPVIIDSAKFRRPVHPSTPMRVAMSSLRKTDAVAFLAGSVSQDGKRCCTANIGFAFAPLGDFFGPETLPHYLRVYRRWLTGTRFEGFERSPQEAVDAAH